MGRRSGADPHRYSVVEAGIDDEFVLSGQAGQSDARRSDDLGEVEIDVVETDAVDTGRDGIDERRGLRHRGEADPRADAEALTDSRENQGVIVARDVHEGGTFAGFIAGEVVLRHSVATFASGTGCTGSFFHGHVIGGKAPLLINRPRRSRVAGFGAHDRMEEERQ